MDVLQLVGAVVIALVVGVLAFGVLGTICAIMLSSKIEQEEEK